MFGKSLIFEILFSPKAVKQLASLDRQVQLRIKEAISKLQSFPPTSDIVKLKGREDEFRLRVGDRRVVFRYQFSTKQVQIIAILPRNEAYKR